VLTRPLDVEFVVAVLLPPDHLLEEAVVIPGALFRCPIPIELHLFQFLLFGLFALLGDLGDLFIKPLLLVLEFPLVPEIERVIGNSLAQLFGLDGQIWHGLELLLPASKYTYCSVSSSAALAYNSSFRLL
jgi:hypothetical protein